MADKKEEAGLDAIRRQIDELDEQIRGALAQLSPKLRGALVLTTMQGISPSEAAKLEGCTTSTLYWRIHEARNQLRQRLQKYVSS